MESLLNKNLFRFEDGVRIIDVDQSISLPSNVNISSVQFLQ